MNQEYICISEITFTIPKTSTIKYETKGQSESQYSKSEKNKKSSCDRSDSISDIHRY